MSSRPTLIIIALLLVCIIGLFVFWKRLRSTLHLTTRQAVVSEPEPKGEPTGSPDVLYQEAIDAIKKGQLDHAEKLLTALKQKYGGQEDEMGSDFSFHATEELRKVECLRKFGAPATDTKENILKRVSIAIKRKDRPALLKLASCGFMLGFLESDSAELVDPEPSIDTVLREASRATWESRFSPLGDDAVMVHSRQKGEDARALYFTKNDRGWYWSGFAWPAPESSP